MTVWNRWEKVATFQDSWAWQRLMSWATCCLGPERTSMKALCCLDGPASTSERLTQVISTLPQNKRELSGDAWPNIKPSRIRRGRIAGRLVLGDSGNSLPGSSSHLVAGSPSGGRLPHSCLSMPELLGQTHTGHLPLLWKGPAGLTRDCIPRTMIGFLPKLEVAASWSARAILLVVTLPS